MSDLGHWNVKAFGTKGHIGEGRKMKKINYGKHKPTGKALALSNKIKGK